MAQFKNFSLKAFLNVLSQKVPVPGGGSAAALAASLGASLIAMVIHYSLGKGQASWIEDKLKVTLRASQKLQKRFLELVDLDAQAYLQVVKSKKASKQVRKRAQAKARAVPREVAQLCYRAIELLPYLVKHGNKYLVSDLEVAAELLLASFNSALALLKAS